MDPLKLKISRTLFETILSNLVPSLPECLHKSFNTAQKSGTYFYVTLTTEASKQAVLPIMQKLCMRFEARPAPGPKIAMHVKNLINDISGNYAI